MQDGKQKGQGLGGLFPPASPHIHEQSAFKWSSTEDVQELLGHVNVSTTMNIYAHATREAKRTSARLLDKVVGGD